MTIRTEAQLQAQFAANITGDIGADDMLDLLDTHFQLRTKRIDAGSFELPSGPNRPTPGTINTTSYLAFAVNDEITFHLTLPSDLDTGAAIIIHVDTAPVASEVGSQVSWELSYLVMPDNNTKTIDTVDGVLTTVDAAVDPTQWTDQEFLFTIPALNIPTNAHELNLKLKRAVSANDGGDVVVHHVYAIVTTKPPGAT